MSHLMPLSGVKRTWPNAVHMSAFDPKRTSTASFWCDAQLRITVPGSAVMLCAEHLSGWIDCMRGASLTRDQSCLPRVIRGIDMEQILTNLIAGALGGVGAGKASPTFDLGTAGNIIAGLVGGGVLGQIATLLLPSVVAAAQSGNLSVSGIVSQAIAGGAGGAILTAIVGAIKNKAMA